MFIERLSSSKSNTFNQCTLRFLYNYWEKYQEDEGVSDEHMKFGSFIHRVLELGYEDSNYEKLNEIALSIQDNYNFKKSKYKGKTKKCFENFLKFNEKLGETVAVELSYLVEVKKGLFLDGIIDRIIKGKEGGYLIIDYKTGREKLKKDLLTDKQLQGYTYAISKLYNVPVHKVTAAHYYPVTNNFVTCKYSKQQIEQYVNDRVMEIWKIRKLKKDQCKPNKNWLCNYCGYKSLCPEYTPTIQIQENKSKRAKKPKWSPDVTPVIINL